MNSHVLVDTKLAQPRYTRGIFVYSLVDRIKQTRGTLNTNYREPCDRWKSTSIRNVHRVNSSSWLAHRSRTAHPKAAQHKSAIIILLSSKPSRLIRGYVSNLKKDVQFNVCWRDNVSYVEMKLHGQSCQAAFHNRLIRHMLRYSGGACFLMDISSSLWIRHLSMGSIYAHGAVTPVL